MVTYHTAAEPAPQMDLSAPAGEEWSGRRDLRAKHSTVVRPYDLRLRPRALAAWDALCPGCGSEVLEHEPIVCVGTWVVANEDGTYTVDLSGAEWHCQRCVTIFQPGGVH